MTVEKAGDIEGPRSRAGLPDDGLEEVRQSPDLPFMTGNHRALNLNESDVVISSAGSCLGVVECRIGIPLLDCPELTSLFPESCFFFDRLGQTVLAISSSCSSSEDRERSSSKESNRCIINLQIWNEFWRHPETPRPSL